VRARLPRDARAERGHGRRPDHLFAERSKPAPPPPAQPQPLAYRPIPGRFIAILKKNESSTGLERVVAHMNATVGRGCVRKRFGSAMRGFSFTLPTNTSGVSQKALIQALSKRSEVGYVFQDYVIKAVGNPGEQRAMHAADGWAAGDFGVLMSSSPAATRLAALPQCRSSPGRA
jgi:hypothetical protein